VHGWLAWCQPVDELNERGESGRRCHCGALTCYVIQFLPRKTWKGGKNIPDLGG